MKKYNHMPLITKEEIRDGLEICANQIIQVLPEFTDKFQGSNSENLWYQPVENKSWTTGFWTGEIWLAYELTKEEVFK